MRLLLLLPLETVGLTALLGCVGLQPHASPPAAEARQPITPAVTPERVGPGRYRIPEVPADVSADDPRLWNAALWVALTADETRDSREFYGGPDDGQRELVCSGSREGAFAPQVPGYPITRLSREERASDFEAWMRGEEPARSRWRLMVSVEQMAEPPRNLKGEFLMVGFSTHESDGTSNTIGGGSHYFAIARDEEDVHLVYSGGFDP